MTGLFARLTTRPASPGPGPAATVQPSGPERAGAALALARELLHSVEQFVISTPDLDTARFLQRVRGTASGLTTRADAPTLVLYREWSRNALTAYATLQRRYVHEREEEMWRLVDTYSRAAALGQHRDAELMDGIQEAHLTMREFSRLDDLKLAREGIEAEIARARKLVDRKAQIDKEHSTNLAREIHRLQSELAAVRGQANYDALTRVFHRGILQDRLAELLGERKPCSLAIMDLDDFKTINDTLGHPVGDRLLMLVGEQLTRAARTVDTVARFGGDEFCFLAPGTSPDQLVTRIAGAVSRRHARLEIDDRVISVLLSLSVGIAASQEGDVPDALVARADAVLLKAKRQKRGGILLAP